MPNFAFGRQDNKEIKEIFVMAANNGTFWRFKTPNPGLIGPGGTRRAVAATFARSSRRRGPLADVRLVESPISSRCRTIASCSAVAKSPEPTPRVRE
jgi:hypothetical protein